jgi:hypothetical protein
MTQEKQHQSTALAELDPPSQDLVRTRLADIERFRQVVRQELREGSDYGVIPGTQRPTLLKPGAEKIAKLMLLADTYEIVTEVVDWDRPLFAYTIRCRLASMETGTLYSEGLGECNSRETKYRYRKVNRVCPECGNDSIIKGKAQFGGGWLCWNKRGGCGAKWKDGAAVIEQQEEGRVENEDVADQKNTILKMAKKRALVDAALSAGRLSDIFTQDMEEMPRVVEVERPSESEQAPANKDAPEAITIRDAGQLVQRAAETYKMGRMDVLHILRDSGALPKDAQNFSEITDYAAAWEHVEQVGERAREEQG